MNDSVRADLVCSSYPSVYYFSPRTHQSIGELSLPVKKTSTMSCVNVYMHILPGFTFDSPPASHGTADVEKPLIVASSAEYHKSASDTT